jgi:hypothetical protein
MALYFKSHAQMVCELLTWSVLLVNFNSVGRK